MRPNGDGIIRWRRWIRCRVFILCVGKKVGRLRVIVDGHPASQCHRRPPRTALATPGALGSMVMSDDWAAISEQLELLNCEDQDLVDADFSLVDHAVNIGSKPSPLDAHGAGVDMVDSFFQYTFEQMASWFGLGVKSPRPTPASPGSMVTKLEPSSTSPRLKYWKHVSGDLRWVGHGLYFVVHASLV